MVLLVIYLLGTKLACVGAMAFSNTGFKQLTIAVCHGAITLSPKGWSYGVCGAIAHKLKILPSLFRYRTLIRDIPPYPIL